MEFFQSAPRDESERHRDIGFLEAQVYKLSEVLGGQRAATKDNVERRLARTADELEDEEEEEPIISEDEDEEEKVIYNPKNLPLVWAVKEEHITIQHTYVGGTLDMQLHVHTDTHTYIHIYI